MLEVRGLVKTFSGGPVVKNVKLEIKPGEFFALLGPSGCGKTTLLRLLAGFEAPTAGEIWMDGQRIDELPPHHRCFNMVFQRYALFPHLTVRANIEFGLRMKSLSPAEILSRVDEILTLVQLQGFGNRSISTLSGGQSQRVALARALVNRPRVLLLDEPLSALDLKLRQQMQIELRALQRRIGQAFVFVTHDQEEAFALADRIAVMNQGGIEQVGTPSEIYDKPRSSFVARFIGSSNFWSGKVQRKNGQWFFHSQAGAEIDLSGSSWDDDASISPGSSVHCMIRPERVRLFANLCEPKTNQENFGDARTKNPSRKNAFEGSVNDVIYRGSFTDYWVHCRELPGQAILASLPNGGDSGTNALKLQPGDVVAVEWDAADLRVLPWGNS